MQKQDFESDLYFNKADVLGAMGGDTIRRLLWLADLVCRRRNVRLLDVNAPKVVGERRAAGLEAKAFLERLLPSGLAVYVRTLKDRTTFERLLGEVFAETGPGELGNVDDTLVEAGHATRSERR